MHRRMPYRRITVKKAAVRKLAVAAVDLPPGLGQAQDRGSFPVQQRMHRTVWSGLGVRQPVIAGRGWSSA
jgi:hypothetical protein